MQKILGSLSKTESRHNEGTQTHAKRLSLLYSVWRLSVLSFLPSQVHTYGLTQFIHYLCPTDHHIVYNRSIWKCLFFVQATPILLFCQMNYVTTGQINSSTDSRLSQILKWVVQNFTQKACIMKTGLLMLWTENNFLLFSLKFIAYVKW